MDIDGWVEPVEDPPVLLAIDTNVLISRLGLVQQLHKRLLSSNVWLFVPHVVVRELDHQKSSPRPDLRHAAQSASLWLRDTLRLSRHTAVHLRLESLSEFRESQRGASEFEEVKNDERILRTLLHNGGSGGWGSVRLWTEDVNFSLAAEAAGIGTLGVGRGVGLQGVLGALGVQDLGEGMELDAVSMPTTPRSTEPNGVFSPMPTYRIGGSGGPRTERGTQSCPPMPPPGTLHRAIALMRSPCPPPLRPKIVTALQAFGDRHGYPAPPPPTPMEEEEYCHEVTKHYIACVDRSSMTLREQARYGAALRTVKRYVGPREKGDRGVRDEEVREAMGVLDEGTGDWAEVIEALGSV